ncbi:hypothetical protein C8R45DRAFT_944684 [Mycena sanguinolenta]|nr:hypothetical protein C8R45DRAFT_944684 [Mycena sanguinolenta]
MANAPRNSSTLTDTTNIGAGGGRTNNVATNGNGKPAAVRGTSTSKDGSGASKNLQTAIPGAKPAPAPPKQGKAKAKGSPMTNAVTAPNGATPGSGATAATGPETMEELRARLAQAEAALAVQGITVTPTIVTVAAAGTRGNAPPPTTSITNGHAQPLTNGPAQPQTPTIASSANTAEPVVQAEEPVKMIAKPRGSTSIQVGMGLAKSHDGFKLYALARSTVQDCVTRADMDLAVPWDKQPLEKRLLVTNAAKNKVKFLKRMENDWATEKLARQYMKNKRVTAYKKGTLERPDKYGYLKVNATMRSADGSRVKKAKLVLDARLAKRALEDKDDGPVERPSKKARTSDMNSPSRRRQQPEFVEGSSRGHEKFVANEWDAHPEMDEEYHPDEYEDAEKHEMEQDSQAGDSDDDGN